MCGIAGILNKNGVVCDRSSNIRFMSESIIKRGPDSDGMWINPSGTLNLAHRRLSIIDATNSGSQPLHSSDCRFTIVFNGEIYNYKELRNQLISEGIHFQSESDTEVILKLFEKYGSSVCSMLRGMFAFAIWDELNSSLFIARDTYGIKPLYYALTSDSLIFSSSVKSILKCNIDSFQINVNSLNLMKAWGHIPNFETCFIGIHELAPGEWIRINSDLVINHCKYSNFEDLIQSKTKSLQNLSLNNLKDKMIESIDYHFVSDVPISIFLSSGIDSISIASMAKELGKDFVAVTIGVEEYKGTNQDETIIASKAAKYFGIEHEIIWISSKTISENLEIFFEDMDQPSIDGFNTWIISRKCSELGIKVALSGLGADELFGGYNTFKNIPRIITILGRLPYYKVLDQMLTSFINRFDNSFKINPKFKNLYKASNSVDDLYSLLRGINYSSSMNIIEALNGNNSRNFFDCLNIYDKVLYLENIFYMQKRLLRDTDWASMSNGLEIRVPFVDLNLTKYVRECANEGLLFNKSDLSSVIPLPIKLLVESRKKTGFDVPILKTIKDKHSYMSSQPKNFNRQLLNIEWCDFVLDKYLSSCAINH
jgi:asparagine synthase (glutamine-hydrolysing)